jgi:hypothetical protein
MFGEEGPLPLHHSLHPSLRQVPTNCFGRERLVDDVLECSGDLDSIFSLPRCDEVDGMVSIGWGELEGTTIQRLGKRGMVLGVKSGDSADSGG